MTLKEAARRVPRSSERPHNAQSRNSCESSELGRTGDGKEGQPIPLFSTGDSLVPNLKHIGAKETGDRLSEIRR